MELEQIVIVGSEYESLTMLGVGEDVSRIMTYWIHNEVEVYTILNRLIDPEECVIHRSPNICLCTS
jgi:hypothetical protein